MNPWTVIALGCLFGLISTTLLYLFAMATRRIRQRKGIIFRFITPLGVAACLLPFIKLYGHVGAILGGTTRNVASIGMLCYALVWFVGAISVVIIFRPKQ